MIKIEIGTSSLKIFGHAKSKIICAGVSAVADMIKIYSAHHMGASCKEEKGFMEINDIPEDAEIRTAFIEYVEALSSEYPAELNIVYEDA